MRPILKALWKIFTSCINVQKRSKDDLVQGLIQCTLDFNNWCIPNNAIILLKDQLHSFGKGGAFDIIDSLYVHELERLATNKHKRELRIVGKKVLAVGIAKAHGTHEFMVRIILLLDNNFPILLGGQLKDIFKMSTVLNLYRAFESGEANTEILVNGIEKMLGRDQPNFNKDEDD